VFVAAAIEVIVCESALPVETVFAFGVIAMASGSRRPRYRR
jgi:hypothetical protein